MLNNFVHMDAYVCHVYVSLDIIFFIVLSDVLLCGLKERAFSLN